MINVSPECYELMQLRTNFLQYADITLADGTELNLGPQHFTVLNNGIIDGAGDTVLPFGNAIEKVIQVEIANTEGEFDEYNFDDAVIELSLKFQLSNSVETIQRGTYTVIEPVMYGETIQMTAADDMYKADQKVTGAITFPITVGTLLTGLCSAVNIDLSANYTFTNSTVQLTQFAGELSDYTYRQLFGYIAQFAGGNARINYNNELEIISYPFAELSAMEDAIASQDVVVLMETFPLTLKFAEYPSSFQDASFALYDSEGTAQKTWNWTTLQSYISGYNIILPTDSTIEAITNVPCILEIKWLSAYDGTWHSYRIILPRPVEPQDHSRNTEVLDAWETLTVATDDIEITGIQVTLSANQLAEDNDEESHDYLTGTDDYVIEFENPFFNYANYSSYLTVISPLLIGGKLRPFAGNHVSNPILEFMDPVFIVDRKGKVYASILTDVEFQVLGKTVLSNSAEPKLRNGRAYSSATETAVIKAAESAGKKIQKIGNYFWHDLDGAHITQIPQEDFIDNPTGANLLATALKLAIREALTEIASFSGTEIELGKNSTDAVIKMLQDTMEIFVSKIATPAELRRTAGSIVMQETYNSNDPSTERVYLDLSAIHKNGNTTKGAYIELIADAINNTSHGGILVDYLDLSLQSLFIQLANLSIAIGSGSNWSQIDLTAATDLFHYSHYDADHSTDADDFSPNSLVRLPNSHGVSNVPITNACFVFTLGSSSTNKIQFCTAANVSTFVLHMRKRSSAATPPWGSWKSITFS